MRGIDKHRAERAFALLLMLSLLALLVLVLLALAVLTKVDTQVATTSSYQIQARQNALLGLNLALGQLEKYSSRDDGQQTGMAGISGVPAKSTMRQWAGVWGGAISPVWLASGGVPGNQPAISGPRITLVGAGSVASPSDKTDQESVEVGLIDIVSATPVTSPAAAVVGRTGYWVGDEGVKLSAVITGTEGLVTGAKHDIQSLTGISPTAAGISSILSYEQLAMITLFKKAPNADEKESIAIKMGQLRVAFHSLSRTHYGIWDDGTIKAGLLNVNSTSWRYWRAVGDTIIKLNPSLGTLNSSSFATEASSLPGRPFQDREQFLSSLDTYLSSGINNQAFKDTIRHWLTVRSDTFRIRAYGDALNATVSSAQPVATAYCEVIVQRVKDSPGDPEGHYIITYFRWLGPDDI
jgi:hypothetical protein